MQILGSELSALGKSPEYCLNYVNINTLKKGGLVAVRVVRFLPTLTSIGLAISLTN